MSLAAFRHQDSRSKRACSRARCRRRCWPTSRRSDQDRAAGGGDDARAFGPPYLIDPEDKENNKTRFIVRQPQQEVVTVKSHCEGQQIIRELAKSATWMMENYKSRPQALQSRLPIDQAVNPASSIARDRFGRPALMRRAAATDATSGEWRLDERHRSHGWRARAAR